MATLTYDTTASATQADGVSSRTWTHTTASQSNRIMIIFACGNNTGTPGNIVVTAVSYNSVAATFIGSISRQAGSQLEMWALLQPATGSNTVSVTWTGTCDVTAHSTTLYNCNLNLADLLNSKSTATGSGTTNSLAITTRSSTAILIGCNSTASNPAVTTGTERAETLNTGAHYTNVATIAAPNAATAYTILWTSVGSSNSGSVGALIYQEGYGKNRVRVH